MNDSYSFEELYTQYRPLIFNFFVSKSLPLDVCDDLTQDLFLNLFKSASTFEGRCKVSSYLYLCAKNLYFEFLRNKRNQFHNKCNVPLEKISHPVMCRNAESVLIGKEEVKCIEILISQLEEEEQELIHARLDKYPLQWIALREGVKETSLKTRLHRTRQKLKRDFTSLMGGES